MGFEEKAFPTAAIAAHPKDMGNHQLYVALFRQMELYDCGMVAAAKLNGCSYE
jgi:hypothetical protein